MGPLVRAAKSYMLLALWLSPLVAFILAQLTYRQLPTACIGYRSRRYSRLHLYRAGSDLGAGDQHHDEPDVHRVHLRLDAGGDPDRERSTALAAHRIVTALLRDNGIRIVVGLFLLTGS